MELAVAEPWWARSAAGKAEGSIEGRHGSQGSREKAGRCARMLGRRQRSMEGRTKKRRRRSAC